MTVAAGTMLQTLSGAALVETLAGSISPTRVFTWDGEKVTVGHVLIEKAHLGVTIRLTLDNELSLFLSPDTLVVLKDSTRGVTKTLAVHTSLMPLYLKTEAQQWFYREPGNWHKSARVSTDLQPWRKVARMVAEWKLGRRLQTGEYIFFADKNRRNCEPENIVIKKCVPNKKPKGKRPKFSAPIFEATGALFELQQLRKRFSNHKVKLAIPDVSRDLFSIRGLDSSNLAADGIFIAVDQN